MEDLKAPGTEYRNRWKSQAEDKQKLFYLESEGIKQCLPSFMLRAGLLTVHHDNLVPAEIILVDILRNNV